MKNSKEKLCIIAVILAIALSVRSVRKLFYRAKATIEEKDAKIAELGKKIARLDSYYFLLNRWIDSKNKGRCIENYFIQNNFKTIAVYGLGKLGYQFCNELEGSSVVNIEYGIDQNVSQEKSAVSLRRLTDTVIPVDVVVVTPIFAFDAIREQLEEKYSCPIISLEEIIYSL